MGNLTGMSLDPSSAQPAAAPQFSPVPAGVYRVVIIESDTRPNKKGNGSYIMLNTEIVAGDFKGRRVRDYLNVEHEQEVTQERAREKWMAVKAAVKVLTPEDTSEVHNIPLLVKVAVKNDPQYGQQNRIDAYYTDDGRQVQGEPLNLTAAARTQSQPAKLATTSPPRAAAKPTRVAAPPVPSDDDIPF